MAFIEVANLVKSYAAPAGRLDVLRGVDLQVEQGEMLAVVGASGVGKSTLLHVLGGLDAFESGNVRIGDAHIEQMADDDRVGFRNQHVGFVFQFHHLLPEFTALENVEMPLWISGTPAGSGAPVRSACSDAWGSRTARTIVLARCPAASSSASRSPVRSSVTRRSCWPTSPPAIWTRRPPPIFSISFARCTGNTGSRRSS